MTILLPPADLNARTPRLRHLRKGTILHQFFDRANQPVHFDKTSNGRLNAPDASYGVLYAAIGLNGAFAETFLRSPGMRQIDPNLLARKAYVRLQSTQDLRLIELAGQGLAAVGATAEITHGGLPYTAPQAWSAALHAHPCAPSGIAYQARHDDREECVALFENRTVSLRKSIARPTSMPTGSGKSRNSTDEPVRRHDARPYRPRPPSVSALPTSATCENACGKFPT